MMRHVWLAAWMLVAVVSVRAQEGDSEVGAAADVPRSGLDAADSALTEFFTHFSGHEPIYFLAGPDAPNVKFQFSFKYAVLNPDAPLVQTFPALAGVNIAYTQLSLWDTSEASAPFFDSNYRPELLWSDEYIPALSRPGLYGLGLQFGVMHESNGRSGLESRSMNVAYVRPVVTFGDVHDFHVTVAPRVQVYLGGQGDNEDIEDFRGYGDLRVTAGWRRGLQVSTLARLGDDWDRGSVQVDVTYPLNKLLFRNFDVYLDVQGFYGYGESLIQYNHRDKVLRVGVAVVR
jgi:outer membrane phospholipase A